tara:strand:+ start:162 stop:923 length:762 start_codon:yes stop_codon:yes gene_type:complete
MNEIDYFRSQNTWMTEQQVDVLIEPGVFVDSLRDLVSAYSVFPVVLHTDDHERKLPSQVFDRVCGLMPTMLPTAYPIFCLTSTQLITKLRGTRSSEWRDVIREHTRISEQTILFVNLRRRQHIRTWDEIFLAEEVGKLSILRTMLQDATIRLLPRAPRAEVRTIVTSPSPQRVVTVSCPPNTCDIMVARAELVNAVPQELLAQWSKIIVHVGPRHQHERPDGPLTFIDSRAVPFTTYNTWMDDIEAFATRQAQ